MSSTTPKRGAELLRSATKKIQSARVLAGAAVGPKKDEPKEKEQEPYAGPLVSLLTDVCRSSGFAYGEVWIRPFRTHRDTDGSKLAQWEYHMHHSGYYFVNKDTFKEAVPGKTVPDEFLPLVGELTYTKGVGVVGYAWQRGEPDWQDLSAVTIINEFLQSDRWITSDKFQKYFDYSVAVPVRHPTWTKVMAVLVFYRSRSAFHGATTEAACAELGNVLANVKTVFPKAYELQKAHEAWERSKELHTEMLRESGSPMASRENMLVSPSGRSIGASSKWSESDQEGDLNEYGFEEGLKGRIKRAMRHHLVHTATQRFKEAGKKMQQRSKNTWETAQTKMTLKWEEMEHKWEPGSFRGKVMTYLKKFKGVGAGPLKGTNPTYCLWTFVGSFLALVCVTGMDDGVGKIQVGERALYALVTSFGAVSLILFSTPNSPFGQPRNVIGGHVLSATTAIVLQYLKPTFMTQFVMNAFAPSVAIFLMSYTGLMHPPAAACCTIYVSGGADKQHIGWLYVFYPVLADTMIMFILALVINNMSNQRQYPLYW